MDTRKVQQLGPSTLAMTLPAEWARDYDVNKGDEVSIRTGRGTLTVLADPGGTEGSEAVITADELDSEAVERAIVSQYVLGRRVIRIVQSEGVLDSETINGIYRAENQLMGLGVVEETPEGIAIRCSVDAEDFDLDNLLGRLESTGSTMRGEAIKSLTHGNPDLAERAINRERQANKIFVLMLRLIFSAYRNPNLARSLGLQSGFPLIGYRSMAKNLELTADNAEDIADIVLERGSEPIGIDSSTTTRIRDFTNQVDDLTELAIQSAVERDYDLTIEARSLFQEISDREIEILRDLPEMNKKDLLQVREVLVSLQQTAQYAMRNAEIAANLSLDEESDHISIE